MASTIKYIKSNVVLFPPNSFLNQFSETKTTEKSDEQF